MAKKDIKSYFSHDADARNDEKIIRLRMRHGAAGYGVYFMILERLRAQSDYMSVSDYNIIAFDLRVDAALIKSVVEDYGLFAFTPDGKCFYSESFLRRMEVKDAISQKRKEAISRRWASTAPNPQPDTNEIQMYPTTDTIVPESRYNKSKEKKTKEKINKKSSDEDQKASATASSASENQNSENHPDPGQPRQPRRSPDTQNAPAAPSPIPIIDKTIAAIADSAPQLAADLATTPQRIIELADTITAQWRITGEFDHRRPLTHLLNAIRKKLNAPSPPASAHSPDPTYTRRKEAERRQRSQSRAIDSAAELQSYLTSRGLDPGSTDLATIAARDSSIPQL